MKKITTMGKRRASESAADYFGNGYHCAEAVAAAALAALGEDPSEAVAHATAFGGGFGQSHKEACGALSGALITIGHFFGRRKAGADWDLSARLAREIRQRFIDDFGTTHCASIRKGFGKAQQMAECRKLTGSVTAKLLALLSEPDFNPVSP